MLKRVSLAGAFFAANVILGCYFTTKRALALGIANSGAGCGAIVLTYLTERSISFYGMKGTFLLIGGLFLNLSVYGALCRPLKPVIKQAYNIPENRRNSSDEKKSATNLAFILEDEIISDTQSEKSVPSSEYIIEEIEEIPNTLQMRRLSAFSEEAPSDFVELKSTFADGSMYKNKYFYLLLFTFLFWGVGDSLMIYYPSYAESVGLDRQQGALVVSVYGASGTVSQILAGILVDVLHVPSTYLFSATLFVLCLSVAFIPFCQTFITVMLDAGLIAMSYSCGIALRIVMVASVLGIEKMSAGYSLLSMMIGVGYTVFPLMSGIVYDMTRSFSFLFKLDSGIVSVGVLLSCGLIYAQKKGKFSK